MDTSELTALRRPVIELPFPSRQNPNARLVADRAMAWAERAGLLADREVRSRVECGALPWFAGWVYPDAPIDRLAVLAALDVVMFLDDDRADEVEHFAGSFVDEMLFGQPTGALAELLPALDRDMPPAWAARLRANMTAWVLTNWEAAVRHGDAPLSVDDYIPWRRAGGTMWWHFDLIEYAAGRELSPEFFGSPPYQGLTEAAADIACWTNDLFSVHKELARGDPHNLLAVFVAHRHLSLQEAADECARWLAARTRSFVALRCGLPPELAWFGDALAAWCRGNLDFCLTSGRYA
jgi:hypothetical protein